MTLPHERLQLAEHIVLASPQLLPETKQCLIWFLRQTDELTRPAILVFPPDVDFNLVFNVTAAADNMGKPFAELVDDKLFLNGFSTKRAQKLGDYQVNGAYFNPDHRCRGFWPEDAAAYVVEADMQAIRKVELLSSGLATPPRTPGPTPPQP